MMLGMRRPRVATMAVLALGCLTGPLVGRFLPASRGLPFQAPDGRHILGTDALGEDVLARLVECAPGTFLVPGAAAATLVVVGTLLGALLGLGPSGLRAVVLRAGDVLLIIPPVALALVIVLGLGAEATTMVAAVVLTGLVPFTRVTAGATAQLARCGHVEVAMGLGDGLLRIAVRDVIPILTGVIAAEAGLRLLAAIQLVAAVSFLGFAPGLGDSWARALRENITGFSLNPWACLAPGMALVLATALIALIAASVERGGRDDRP